MRSLKFKLNFYLDFKGIYLSKALTCMTIFLYKQELFLSSRRPNCGMNNLYL